MCALAPTCSVLSATLIVPRSARRLTLALGNGGHGLGGTSFIASVQTSKLSRGMVRGLFGGLLGMRAG